METHKEIDKRSLALARAIVNKIDMDPKKEGIKKAKSVCKNWYKIHKTKYIKEWLDLLEKSWIEIKNVLLDESENGIRLRQNNPFCGILTNKERWAIYKRFVKYEKRAS